MLTFGTEIVILYIAKECVRLRPIPPPTAGYFPTLHTGPSTGVYAYNSIKNNVGYTTSCMCYGMHTMKIVRVLIFQCYCCCNYSDNLHNGKCCSICIHCMHCVSFMQLASANLIVTFMTLLGQPWLTDIGCLSVLLSVPDVVV